MNEKPKCDTYCSVDEPVPFQVIPSVLTLEAPLDDDIAKAIWQRQTNLYRPDIGTSFC